jgi:hypothetical protein
MIIAVSSAPIVDKAREVQLLSDRYKLEVQEDPTPKICSQYGFQTIYDMPSELQCKVREQIIETHRDYVSQWDDVLLSYSVVEWLADWMRWSWNTVSTERWAKVLATASSSVGRYDQLYHLEHNVRRPYDGYVWLDKENSAQVNSMMRFLFQELGVVDKVRYTID